MVLVKHTLLNSVKQFTSARRKFAATGRFVRAPVTLVI